MLDPSLKAQLQAYLEKLVLPIELIASLDDGDKSQELWALLSEIGGNAKANFMRYAKIQSLGQILACNYTDAVKIIEKKRAAS